MLTHGIAPDVTAASIYFSNTHYGVCVCVFFPSILDIKFVGRTSRGHTGGRSHRIFNPPSFCGACLDFSREKDSAIPFPRRPIKYVQRQNISTITAVLTRFTERVHATTVVVVVVITYSRVQINRKVANPVHMIS